MLACSSPTGDLALVDASAYCSLISSHLRRLHRLRFDGRDTLVKLIKRAGEGLKSC
jgi:hypothetical protein